MQGAVAMAGGVREDQVAVASTGVIGVALPNWLRARSQMPGSLPPVCTAMAYSGISMRVMPAMISRQIRATAAKGKGLSWRWNRARRISASRPGRTVVIESRAFTRRISSTRAARCTISACRSESMRSISPRRSCSDVPVSFIGTSSAGKAAN